MALQSSGQIDISDIQTELGSSSGSLRTLSAAAGKSVPDAMSEFYGYQSSSALISYTADGGTDSFTGMGFKPDALFGMNAKNGGNNWWSSSNSNTTFVGKYTPNYSGIISSFDSDGYTITNANPYLNDSGLMFVLGMQGGGSTTTLTAGSINSVVNGSSSTGFSLVKYTGNGVNGATVAHGLGSAPEAIWIRRTDANSHTVIYHSAMGNTKLQFLTADTQNQYPQQTGVWNNTTPTSSVFTISNSSYVNTSGGTYEAYCFSNTTGKIKCGGYTGTGSAQTITLGFQPLVVFTDLYTGFANGVSHFKNGSATKSKNFSQLHGPRNTNLFGSNSWTTENHASGSSYWYIALGE